MSNGLSQVQSVALSQKLAMTQQMKQSIEVLASDSLELEQRIVAELTENPALEEYDPDEELRDEDVPSGMGTLLDAEGQEHPEEAMLRDWEEAAFSDASATGSKDRNLDGLLVDGEVVVSRGSEQLDYDGITQEDWDGSIRDNVAREVTGNLALPDVDSAKFLENSQLMALECPSGRNDLDELPTAPEDRRPRQETLSAHLEGQLGALRLNPREREFALFVIGNLDRGGFLVLKDIGRDPEGQGGSDVSSLDGMDGEADGIEEGRTGGLPMDATVSDGEEPGAPRRGKVGRKRKATPAVKEAPVGLDTELSQMPMRDFMLKLFWEEKLCRLESSVEEFVREGRIRRVAPRDDLSIDREREILERIQRMDPVGVATRSIRESLLVQADELQKTEEKQDDRLTQIIQLIQDHLDDLGKNRRPKVAEALGITERRLDSLVKEMLRRLNPRPGAEYDGEEIQVKRADVMVVQDGEDFIVDVVRSSMPSIRVKPEYQKKVEEMGRRRRDEGSGGENRSNDFIRNMVARGNGMVSAVAKRRETILNVSRTIVERQKEFFQKGPAFLKPLTLKDVADDIGVHESTISRATAGKYMVTPHGLYELKYFFNAALQTANGEEVANEVVRNRIRKIIDGEDCRKPLSDEAIAGILKSEGINVARRTVAKYRDALNIPRASGRKKYPG